MKKFKIIIILMLFIVLLGVKANDLVLKEGQTLVGYDLYDGYINPSQLISSSLNYYIDTKEEKEFKVYQYQGGNNWHAYDDELRRFIPMSQTSIYDLGLTRFIYHVKENIRAIPEKKLEEEASFVYNNKYYFLISDLKEKNISSPLDYEGYLIYHSNEIIGYDINLDEHFYRKLKESDVVNVRDYGAVGDDVNDDTYSIQSAVNKINENGGVLYFPNGEYIMEIKTGWTPKLHDESLIYIETDKKVILEFADSTIKMQDGREVKDNLLSHYNVIKVQDSSDVIIQNGKLIGDRIDHCYYKEADSINDECEHPTKSSYYYPTHEFGFGINIKSNTDEDKKIVIDNMDISEMTGDCIIVDDVSNASNITIKNSELYNARRQGISILQINKILVKDTKIHDIGHNDGVNGTDPMSGIDIEPELESGSCANVKVNDVNFDNLDIRDTSSNGIVIGITVSCRNYDVIDDFNIKNSYIEGLTISEGFIETSTINNKMSDNCFNNEGKITNKYISSGNLNIKDSNIYVYDNSLIYSGASKNIGITNSIIDNSEIIVNSEDRLPMNFRNTKLTNSHLMGGSFTLSAATNGNNMKLSEGSGNNIYDNFYMTVKDNAFIEENSIVKNSHIMTHYETQTFNNISFYNTNITHAWNAGNSVLFNNCNFNNVDISRFYAKDLGTYYLNGNSINKKCVFNYKDNNNCVDF